PRDGVREVPELGDGAGDGRVGLGGLGDSMARRQRRTRRHQDVEELHITAFMNLMVVLVPFLLITAVFSRMSILELNLPGPSSEPVPLEEPQFNLEVIV